MTTATAAPGLHRGDAKAEIMTTAEALFRAAGVQWRPGRMAKHVARELNRGGHVAACLFVVDEMTDNGVRVTWSRRDLVGMIDPTGEYAAARADVIHAARLIANGNLEDANRVLDLDKKNAPAGQGEGEVTTAEGAKK